MSQFNSILLKRVYSGVQQIKGNFVADNLCVTAIYNPDYRLGRIDIFMPSQTEFMPLRSKEMLEDTSESKLVKLADRLFKKLKKQLQQEQDCVFH